MDSFRRPASVGVISPKTEISWAIEANSIAYSKTNLCLTLRFVKNPHSWNADAEVLALEAYAEGAGAALTCAYSTSAVFDTALIAARRGAGVYGPRRHRKQMLATAAGLVALLFPL